ncbi:MAG: NPCBM/NEW2 domain-containing protein [Planctomycetota bacterium]|nr:NPCBM/NEW2 domain-containing protein [Planctomycetota bacterium]
MFFLLIALTTQSISLNLSAPEVTVRAIGGETVTGKLLDWTESAMTVEAGEGEQQIDNEALASVAFVPVAGSAPADASLTSAIQIEFVDRSELISSNFTSLDREATITGATITGATSSEHRFPLDSVRSVRFPLTDPGLLRAWDRLRKKPRRVDRLAVRKGEEIDYVDGVISRVTPQRVDFLLDGELIPVTRTTLVGLLFADRKVAAMRPARCQLSTRDGSSLVLSGWEYQPDHLVAKTPAGLLLPLPYAELREIDFLRERIVYLSRIKPLRAEWTPYLAVGNLGPTLAGFYAPQRERTGEAAERASTAGRFEIVTLPIEDPADGSQRPPEVESYREGLAIHSKSRLVFDLPRDAQRFETRVGIDARTAHLGSVDLEILADGESLFAEEISGETGPRDVSVDIEGAQRLEIRVGFGKNLDLGDRVNFCNARIVK